MMVLPTDLDGAARIEAEQETIKMKTIGVRLMAIRSAEEDHQDQEGDQNAEQRTRDDKPE